MEIDILGIDSMGVDILGIDILALPPSLQQKKSQDLDGPQPTLASITAL